MERNEIFGGLAVTLSQCFQRGVNEHADIIGGCFRNLGNLPVAEIVLEFQLNDFLLPRGQRGHDS